MKNLSVSVEWNRSLPGGYHEMCLQATTASDDFFSDARPGQFVHLDCRSPDLVLRRPFSICRCDVQAKRVDLLYRVVGKGTRAMRKWRPGEKTSLLGPIGHPFSWPASDQKSILLAGGVGIAPMMFLAQKLATMKRKTLFLFGTETDPPWMISKSHSLVVLDRLGVPNQLASLKLKTDSGFFKGHVTDLAEHHLQSMCREELKKTTLFACGPLPMLLAAARLAARYAVRGEASLEAHMACGFGGCAGCVVSMRNAPPARVCVDGPVFPLTSVLELEQQE